MPQESILSPLVRLHTQPSDHSGKGGEWMIIHVWVSHMYGSQKGCKICTFYTVFTWTFLVMWLVLLSWTCKYGIPREKTQNGYYWAHSIVSGSIHSLPISLDFYIPLLSFGWALRGNGDKCGCSSHYIQIEILWYFSEAALFWQHFGD